MKPRISLGFTLVELLVVIAIISLLASIVLSSLNVTRAKSRDSRRLLDFHQFETALELFYDTYGVYPCADKTSNWDSSKSDPFLGGSCPASATSKEDCPTGIVDAPACPLPPAHGLYFEGLYPVKNNRDPVNSGGCQSQPGGNTDCGSIGYYYGYKPSTDRKSYVLYTNLETQSELENNVNDHGLCNNFYEIGPGVGVIGLSGEKVFGTNCN